MKRFTSRFALVELCVVLAVMAILATFAAPSFIAMFAVPAYWTQQVQAHRLFAASAVTRAVQFVETARLAQTSASGDVITLSAGLDRAPSSGAPVYRLSVLAESPTNGGYAIEAMPVVPGAMQDDACGTFVMEATGLRWNHAPGATAALDAAQSAGCWAGKG